MESLVKLEDVNVFYDRGQGSKETEALRNISLEIYPGEYVIFFGPSGCGKSTLLNTIAGLQDISSGKVFVCGKELSKLSDDEIAVYHRHEVGFIFQAYNLIPTLSVLENIALPQMFDGASKIVWKQNALELTRRFGIEEQNSKLPQELSGGQQQRVGIARALINNPAIVLADEPTGNLDSKNVRLVLDILQDLNLKEKKTILLVTHSMDYLTEADRIFYIKDGTIIKEERNAKREKKPIIETRGMGEGEKPTLEFEKLTEFLLAIPEEQIMSRIKEILGKRLRNEIDRQQMISLFDKPLTEGGAELNSRTALRLSKMVEHIIANAEIISKAKVIPEVELESTLSYLRVDIEGILGLKLTLSQKNRLNEVIKERLKNKFDLNQTRQKCDVPLQDGGVGLRRETAKKVAYYLELILPIANYTHLSSKDQISDTNVVKDQSLTEASK